MVSYEVLKMAGRAGCNSVFCFYSVVLANIKLKCMQRALSAQTLSNIYAYFIYIPNNTL